MSATNAESTITPSLIQYQSSVNHAVIAVYYGRPIGRAILFWSCGLFLLSFSSFFFSSPILSGRRLDVYHSSTHDMALVRIQNASLKCAAARSSLKIQDAKMTQNISICAPSHNFIRQYLHNEGIYRQSKKKLLNRNISSTCPHNMVDVRPLTAEIGLPV